MDFPFMPAMPLLSASGPMPVAVPPAAELVVRISVIAALFILVVVSAKLRRRLHRGPRGKNSRAGLTRLEETGIIDIAAFYAVGVFFIYGLFLESAISAFAFGIAATYFLDNAMSFVHRKRLRHVRSQGAMRYIEELGVLEAAMLASAIYLFLSGYYLYSVLLSWAFGMVFATMVDRVRIRMRL